MKITKDDFDIWRASPITQAFLVVISSMADTAREQWATASWNNERLWREPNAAAELRAACRARAECAEDILLFRFEEEEQDEPRDISI